MIVRHFVYQDVVDKPSVLVKHRRVLSLAGVQRGGGIGGDAVDEAESLSPADLNFTHVADVEQAHRPAHGKVLFHDSGILNGHLPAAKINHSGAQAHMHAVKRSTPQ